MIEAVSASSWRAGGAASRLTLPTITAWGYFRALARPLPRLPRHARGSAKRPPKPSPHGTNNDCFGAGTDQVRDHLKTAKALGLTVPLPLLRSDTEKWGRVIRAANIKLEPSR